MFLKRNKKEDGDIVTEDRFKQGTVSELIEVTVSYKDVLKENKVFAIKSPYLKSVTFEEIVNLIEKKQLKDNQRILKKYLKAQKKNISLS